MAEVLKAGKYLGCRVKSLNVNGLIYTDTLYESRNEFLPHSHENFYLAYVLEGSYIEKTGRNTERCMPGSVVTHMINEVHSNTSFSKSCRILNIEIQNDWLGKYSLTHETIRQNLETNSIALKYTLLKLCSEFMLSDSFSYLSLESNLLSAVSGIISEGSFHKANVPEWVSIVKQILYDDEAANLNLTYISNACGKHPAHISRDFSKYFPCQMSEYVRLAKIEKSLSYLKSPSHSLSEISYICGFADQSHFTRVFRRIKGITPKAWRDMLLN